MLEPVNSELTSSPALARHLIELRLALESARGAEDETRARSLFYRRLNEEQAGEA
ncbi:MAG: hypothetical protein ACRDNY_00900 [Gaiellaceae bacterium]